MTKKEILEYFSDISFVYNNAMAYDNLSHMLDELIGEDRQEIVRCEKCIYGDDFDCPAPLSTGYLCQKGHGSHTGDWFCADGERRETNDKE